MLLFGTLIVDSVYIAMKVPDQCNGQNMNTLGHNMKEEFALHSVDRLKVNIAMTFDSKVISVI